MKNADRLGQCQVFTALSEAELGKMSALAAEKEYAAGSTVFQEGEPAEEFFIVEEGKVALQMMLPNGSGETGRRVTVDIIGAHEALGWSAIVEPFVYTLAAVCLQKTKMLSINAVAMRGLLGNNHQMSHGISRGLVKVIADRLDVTRRVLVSERLVTPKSE